MTPLSPKTRQHIDALFAPADRAAVERKLLDWREADSERLRFAALRLSHGEWEALDEAVKLGRTDWRDLLMAADFGDVGAHEAWVPRRFTPEVGETWLAGGEVEGVRFRRGDLVQRQSSWGLGARGRIKSLVALEPQPTYIVVLETGAEDRLLQLWLQQAE